MITTACTSIASYGAVLKLHLRCDNKSPKSVSGSGPAVVEIEAILYSG